MLASLLPRVRSRDEDDGDFLLLLWKQLSPDEKERFFFSVAISCSILSAYWSWRGGGKTEKSIKNRAEIILKRQGEETPLPPHSKFTWALTPTRQVIVEEEDKELFSLSFFWGANYSWQEATGGDKRRKSVAETILIIQSTFNLQSGVFLEKKIAKQSFFTKFCTSIYNRDIKSKFTFPSLYYSAC